MHRLSILVTPIRWLRGSMSRLGRTEPFLCRMSMSGSGGEPKFNAMATNDERGG
ncbi:hypothetical protein SS05631_b52560 (plasmid) [Sinorhizobium sp. CCBAU 05631]|uniref:Uncharacterized protein n=1 Tax=Rhizobium fredii TaxID=380 RepID=A0A2L0HEF4_RHIFR|nr:hypothetical protein SS05631_b52560 [Sinorhizobium sp. CCBAU 05631]AUX79562.1 hypothetical protein NXT3_PC00397 [Sinorhizobium fredii]